MKIWGNNNTSTTALRGLSELILDFSDSAKLELCEQLTDYQSLSNLFSQNDNSWDVDFAILKKMLEQFSDEDSNKAIVSLFNRINNFSSQETKDFFDLLAETNQQLPTNWKHYWGRQTDLYRRFSDNSEFKRHSTELFELISLTKNYPEQFDGTFYEYLDLEILDYKYLTGYNSIGSFLVDILRTPFAKNTNAISKVMETIDQNNGSFVGFLRLETNEQTIESAIKWINSHSYKDLIQTEIPKLIELYVELDLINEALYLRSRLSK